MKTTTSLTIDLEVLFKAKQKISNLSKFVEDCLINHLDLVQDNDLDSIQSNIERIKIQLMVLEAKKAEVGKNIKKKAKKAVVIEK